MNPLFATHLWVTTHQLGNPFKKAVRRLRTLTARLFQDSHGHHDSRRWGAEHTRCLGLLQGGDGGAVLGRVVGVRALVTCWGQCLARLRCRAGEKKGAQRHIKIAVEADLISHNENRT